MRERTRTFSASTSTGGQFWLERDANGRSINSSERYELTQLFKLGNDNSGHKRSTIISQRTERTA